MINKSKTTGDLGGDANPQKALCFANFYTMKLGKSIP